MTQDVHFHSKKEKREQNEKILTQNKTKNQLGKLQALHFHVWYQSTLQFYNSIQIHSLKHASFLGCSPSLVLTLLSSGISNIFGVFKEIQALHSHIHTYGLCESKWSYKSELWVVDFLSHGGRFHNTFLLSLTLKQVSHGGSSKICCLLGLKYGTLHKLPLYQIFVYGNFLYCLRLAVLDLFL